MLRWKSEDALRAFTLAYMYKTTSNTRSGWSIQADIAVVSSVRTTTTADAITESSQRHAGQFGGSSHRGSAEAGFQTAWADRAASVVGRSFSHTSCQIVNACDRRDPDAQGEQD